MKNKSKILFIFMILLTMLFTACTSTNQKEVKPDDSKTQQGEIKTDEGKSSSDSKVNIVFRDGVTALTLAKMMDEKAIENINYDMVASPDVLTSKVLNKEADIAIVPSNFAATAYNKGLGYKIVGTSVWGNAYILSKDESVKTLADIKGKKLTLFAKGLTPDLMTRFALKSNGIDPDKDVEMEYLSSPTEIAPAFLGGKADIVVAPEPMATAITLKDEKAVRLASLNEEAKKAGMENGYPQATLIVKEELIEKDKDLVDTIIASYENSIKWAVENKEGLATLSEMYELGVQKPAVIKGLENMNIGKFIITSTKDYDKYFEILKEDNPQSIGGKIPDLNAYYEK